MWNGQYSASVYSGTFTVVNGVCYTVTFSYCITMTPVALQKAVLGLFKTDCMPKFSQLFTGTGHSYLDITMNVGYGSPLLHTSAGVRADPGH